jgi:hypothetical protein
MDGQKDKKRAAPISYRPPAELRDEFHARVTNSGLSTSAYITKAVFGNDAPRGARRQGIEQQALAKLLAEAARIRDELHEISIAGGDAAGNTLLIETACEDLAEIRAALLLAMERKP